MLASSVTPGVGGGGQRENDALTSQAARNGEPQVQCLPYLKNKASRDG